MLFPRGPGTRSGAPRTLRTCYPAPPRLGTPAGSIRGAGRGASREASRGPGDSQQDLQGAQGPSLSELQDLHSLLIQEIKSLKKSVRYSRRLESVSMGAVRGLRDEVADMRALLREEIAPGNAASKREFHAGAAK